MLLATVLPRSSSVASFNPSSCRIQGMAHISFALMLVPVHQTSPAFSSALCTPPSRSRHAGLLPVASASTRAAIAAAPQGRPKRRRRHAVAFVPAKGSEKSKEPSATVVNASSDSTSAILDALREIGLSVEETRRLVTRRPRALRLSAESDIKPTVEYLKKTLRLSDKQVKAVVVFAPQIFAHSPITEFPERVAFLKQRARIPQSALATAIAKRPHILWMDIHSASAVVDLVMAACPVILPDTLGTVFARVPQALLTSPVEVSHNLEYLAGCIMVPGAMARIISKLPLTLVFAQKTMDKRVQFLQKELQLPDHVIGKVIVANPDIFQWSIEQRLLPAVEEIAKVVGREYVPSVITKLPAIFNATDGIQSRVSWLQEVVGLSDAEINSILREAPAILTYSVCGNLNPKWAFIHGTMGAKREDVLDAPREIFCANLQQRAMPRYAFVMSKLGPGATPVSVSSILRGNDIDFCRDVVHCDPAEYRKFVDEDRYLFFFSQLM